MVRIPGSHPGGPGSIPGNGKLFEKVFSWKALLSSYAQKLPEDSSERTRKILRRPGIEPGSTAWKAAMLTIIPPTLFASSYPVPIPISTIKLNWNAIESLNVHFANDGEEEEE